MSYNVNEIRKLQNKLQRKINILKMFTEYQDFNYEPPQMTYDKATGNVTIIDPKEERAK